MSCAAAVLVASTCSYTGRLGSFQWHWQQQRQQWQQRQQQWGYRQHQWAYGRLCQWQWLCQCQWLWRQQWRWQRHHDQHSNGCTSSAPTQRGYHARHQQWQNAATTTAPAAAAAAEASPAWADCGHFIPARACECTARVWQPRCPAGRGHQILAEIP